jgi:class 3 adenylate cyclase
MGLPGGDGVTFLFSDIEGSTRLAQELGPERWPAVLREHDGLVDRAVMTAGGTVVKHEGDGAFAAFAEPLDAVAAAVAMSRDLAVMSAGDGRDVRVRIGIHTGAGQATEDGSDYVGVDVHYAARIEAAANGGQIVLSDATVLALTGPPPPDPSSRTTASIRCATSRSRAASTGWSSRAPLRIRDRFGRFGCRRTCRSRSPRSSGANRSCARSGTSSSAPGS